MIKINIKTFNDGSFKGYYLYNIMKLRPIETCRYNIFPCNKLF